MGLRRSAGFWISAFLISLATAQNSAPPQHVVQDWSTGHIVFTGLTPDNLSGAVRTDPRAWHSWLDHARYNFGPPALLIEDRARHKNHLEKRKADWQMPIGTIYGELSSPAKFSFNVNATPDCANDYVVFPTSNSSVRGISGGDASLIAFNELYTGPGPSGICPTPTAPATQPSVLFAYNTATAPGSGIGFAELSPVLSLDGKKIAFVESNSGGLSNYTAFHVLTWKAGEGTAWNSAALPGNCSSGNSCLTTAVLSNTHSDSQSNPFIDYAHDIAYVGDDGGVLHKITPVFNGIPVEVVGGGWPVQLPFTGWMQSPVYDSVSGSIFVTATNSSGALYLVNAATGTVHASNPLNTIGLSDPIVDSTNQTVFVFFADSNLNLSVAQFDTSGTLLREISAGTVDGFVTTGSFDHNYYTSPPSGSLYFAGPVNYIASLYAVGFTGTTMNPSFNGPLVLTNSSSLSVPTRLTEFFNPTFPSAQDRLFVGIEENCATGSPDGCIETFDISNGFPSGILDSRAHVTIGAQGGLSGIIVDNVSSLAQASSFYFEADSPTGSSTAAAIKLTQSGLQ